MSKYGLDTSVTLAINGTGQRVRLCGAQRGLPPVLIVQAGPGLPLLNEAPRFQLRLDLEQSFTVAYWDQRGCGPAARQHAHSVSLATQVDDACAVIRWLAEETQQPVVLLGISLGATFALQAAARETTHVKSVVVVSMDTDTAAHDAAAFSFLQHAVGEAGDSRLARSVKKLGAPPYTAPGPFQLRARLLSDLGGIEQGKRYGKLLRGLLFSLIRTYGWLGALTSLRNMNTVQGRLLPELATLNLFADWPRPAVPVRYVFGGRDPLNTRTMVQRVARIITGKDRVVTLPNAGHMAHFDEPAMVRFFMQQAYVNPARDLISM